MPLHSRQFLSLWSSRESRESERESRKSEIAHRKHTEQNRRWWRRRTVDSSVLRWLLLLLLQHPLSFNFLKSSWWLQSSSSSSRGWKRKGARKKCERVNCALRRTYCCCTSLAERKATTVWLAVSNWPARSNRQQQVSVCECLCFSESTQQKWWSFCVAERYFLFGQAYRCRISGCYCTTTTATAIDAAAAVVVVCTCTCSAQLKQWSRWRWWWWQWCSFELMMRFATLSLPPLTAETLTVLSLWVLIKFGNVGGSSSIMMIVLAMMVVVKWSRSLQGNLAQR